MNNKDLNLLRIFMAIWTTKNVSEAAKRVALSQPAMSNALARLRDQFGDPLFVRSGRGIVPTKQAEAMAPQVEMILRSVNELYGQRASFDPKLDGGEIRLATTDYIEELFMSKIIEALERKAPHVQITCMPLKFELPKDDMESGKVDLAIAGFFKDIPEGFRQQKLFEDRFGCVGRRGVIQGKMNLKKYLEAKHLLIAPSGGKTGIVDRILAEKKLERKIVCTLANFLSPGPILARTNTLLTAPERLCQHFVDTYGLQKFEPPIAIKAIQVHQVWHTRVDKDPLLSWFRQLLFELTR